MKLPTPPDDKGCTIFLQGVQPIARDCLGYEPCTHGMIAVQEQERQRIAADLHDGLGQSLCFIARSIEEFIENFQRTGVSVDRTPLNDAMGHSKDAMDELRRIVVRLQPSILDDLGIVKALGWLCRESGKTNAGIQAHFECEVSEQDVPDCLKLSVLRIAQEALSNVARHAGPACATVSLRKTETRLHLRIEDDGCGLQGAPVRLAALDGTGGGMGLLNMRQRVESQGGQFRIASAPGRGTSVQASWTWVKFSD